MYPSIAGIIYILFHIMEECSIAKISAILFITEESQNNVAANKG
jgi:hypothetical protein